MDELEILQALVSRLAEHEDHLAVVAFRKEGADEWTYQRVESRSTRMNWKRRETEMSRTSASRTLSTTNWSNSAEAE